MTQDEIRKRYSGIQTFLTDGCYFLSLCSIAEECTGIRVDILDAISHSVTHGWATSDAFINEPCKILKYLTGGKTEWRLDVEPKVPEKVPEEMYVVLKYFNTRTGYTHFKRRYVDTLQDSRTVAEGKIISCYCFTRG